MRHTLLIIALLLCSTMSIAQNCYVLVVGVSRYQDEYNNLSQTTKDAKAFARLMKTQTENVSILTSRYANCSDIKEMLKTIGSRAKQDDTIIFYYSGHGSRGGLYVYDGYLPYTDLLDILHASKCGTILTFVDACHAGSVADKISDISVPQYEWIGRTSDSGLIFMMGCRSDESSYEHPWVGNGYFTSALIKGLRGRADRNVDKVITIEELFRYVYADVVRRSHDGQHPQLIASPTSYETVVIRWDQ